MRYALCAMLFLADTGELLARQHIHNPFAADACF
jgi:hypothetical protein